MNNKKHLPVYGIGPFLGAGMVLMTALAVVLFHYVFGIGIADGIFAVLLRVAGIVLIISGVTVWFTGALRSDMDNNIKENCLKTDGIYAYVRNPMYSGIWLCFSGIGLMWHNYFAVPVIFINWFILTTVLKATEEKWLRDLYGQKYIDYCKRVNRCIPWFPAK